MPISLKKTLSLTALFSLPSFFFTFLPNEAIAATDFEVCIRELIETGLNANNAAESCAQALNPKELSNCVNKVNYYTNITPEEVLKQCFLVRRPQELASCVTEITKETDNTDPNLVVGYCRRSLLPKRYADCVLGVSSQGNIPSNEALDVCISTKGYQFKSTILSPK